MENLYGLPGADGVPVWVEGIIPEGQLSRLGAFGNFLRSVIRVRNFLL